MYSKTSKAAKFCENSYFSKDQMHQQQLFLDYFNTRIIHGLKLISYAPLPIKLLFLLRLNRGLTNLRLS